MLKINKIIGLHNYNKIGSIKIFFVLYFVISQKPCIDPPLFIGQQEQKGLDKGGGQMNGILELNYLKTNRPCSMKMNNDVGNKELQKVSTFGNYRVALLI